MENNRLSSWKRLKKLFLELLDGDVSRFKLLREFIKEDWIDLARGWPVFSVLAVVAMLGVWWGTSMWKDKPADNLRQHLNTTKEELTKAERDRDKYFLALQPWQALAARMETNVIPSEQLYTFLKRVEALTNLFSDTSAIDFVLYANETLITNGCRINLGPSREIRFKAKNVGRISAQNATIGFCPLASETNFNTTGWRRSGSADHQRNGMKIGTVPLFTATALQSLPDDYSYLPNTITVLTNFTAPLLIADVTVHADRVAKYERRVEFILEFPIN